MSQRKFNIKIDTISKDQLNIIQRKSFNNHNNSNNEYHTHMHGAIRPHLGFITIPKGIQVYIKSIFGIEYCVNARQSNIPVIKYKNQEYLDSIYSSNVIIQQEKQKNYQDLHKFPSQSIIPDINLSYRGESNKLIMKKDRLLSLNRELRSLRNRLHKGYTIKSSFNEVVQKNLTVRQSKSIQDRITTINALLGRYVYMSTVEENGVRHITGPALKYELEENGATVYLSKFTMKPTV